jgi:MFS transporter, DHA1 family, tetracycline resistance protein
MRKPSLFIIFLTVFIDLVGFGIVLPLLPIFAKSLEASGFVIGCLMATYSAMQFIFAPIWGRLSDRVGRRPILLLSTAGAAVSYAVFAIGSGQSGTAALILLFVARIAAGICGANITVAQAYIADITPPEERSKRMGLIGMAFGLGFIFGPVIGGLALNSGHLSAPGWVASGLCAFNFVFAFLRLPESRKPGSSPIEKRPRVQQFLHTMKQPGISTLVGVFFLATFCFTCFETTLGLLVSENFNLQFESFKGGLHHFDPKVTYLYAFCGIVGAFVQGGPLGKIVKRMGEPSLIAWSLVLVGVALIPMPFVGNWPLLLLVLAVLAIGSSLTRPPVFGMLSNLASSHEQGATIGAAQSAGSLARILGPIFAGTLFQFHPSWPYVVCGVVALLTGLVCAPMLKRAAATIPSRMADSAGTAA